MKQKLIVLLLLLLPGLIAAQVVFNKKLINTGGASISDIAGLPDGGMVMLCKLGSTNGIARTDVNGNFLWAKSLSQEFTNVRVSPNQMIYALSYNHLIKVDASGNLLWAKSSATQLVNFDIGKNSDLYLIGGSNVAKCDSNGTLVWNKAMPGLAISYIDARKHGGAYVTFNGYTSTNLYNYGNLARLDDAGNVLWTMTSNNSYFKYDRVVETVDRQVVVLGRDLNPNNSFTPLRYLRYDSTGTSIWKYWGSSSFIFSSFATDIVATADSGFAIIGSGSSGPPSFYSDNFISMVSKTGSSGYSANYLIHGNQFSNGAMGGAIDVGPDGTVMFAHNYSFGFNPNRAWYGKKKPGITQCSDLSPSSLPSYTVTLQSGSVFPSNQSITLGAATVTSGNLTAQDSLICSYCFQTPSATFTSSGNGFAFNFSNTAAPGINCTWNFGDGQSATGSSPSHTYAQGGTYTVCLTASNACSTVTACQSVVAICLTQNTPYPAPSLLNDTAVCSPSLLSVSSPSGYTNHLWSNGATTTSTTMNAPGTISLIVQSPTSGCYYTDTLVATNLAFGMSLGPDIMVCPGSMATLSPGSGLGNYAWSTGATTSSISVGTPGTYSVTVTSPQGCFKSDTIVVGNYSVNSLSISPGGPISICAGATTTLTATPGFASYQWSNGSTMAAINVSSAGTYAVTATDANGCTNSAAVTVSVLPSPTPNVTGPGSNSFCQGSTATLQASPGYSNYLWTTGHTTPSITISTGGTYTVTVTDANGCTGTGSITMTVLTAPPVTITPSGSTSICPGSSVTLTATSGFSTYSWSNGATTQSISVNSAGNYSVTATAANGCTSTAGPTTVSVISINAPTITPSGPTTFCAGGSVTLTASPGYSTYNWSNGATTQSITVTNSGTYTVTATQNGCTATSAPTQVTVLSAPPVTITPSGSTSICPGSSVTLTATAGFSTYSWSNGATTQSISVNSAGNYSVTATAANGCTSTAGPTTVSVISINAPTITPSGPTTFCAGGNVTLTASPGYSSYSWSNGATTQSITVTNSGTYTVTATQNGCTATSAPIQVTVLPAPAVSITATNNGNICFGVATTLSATTGYTAYAWSNGSTATSITVSIAGTYTVTVTNSQGCTSVVSRVVSSITQCQVPTGLFESQISSSSAILNWNAVPCATDYQLQYRKTGTNNWTSVSTTNNSYKVTGLIGITNYEWRVRARCNGLGGWTAYSPIKAFSTMFMKSANAPQADGNMLSVAIAPNPNDGNFDLVISMGEKAGIRIELFDVAGKLLHTESIAEPFDELRHHLNLNHLAKGIVILWLTSTNGQIAHERIVLQ